MTSLCTRLSAYERRVTYRRAPGTDAPWFGTIDGSHPVLVSAPHACMHKRDGDWKMEEEFTAAFAQALAEDTGCHAIYVKRKTAEDPNWQHAGLYKQAIAGQIGRSGIRLLVDLHGMTNRHRMGVAIGTMCGKACVGRDVISPFVESGFRRTDVDQLQVPANVFWRRLVVDHPRFTGGLRNQTVTRFASQQMGIAAVQVELSSVARVVHSPSTEDWSQEYSGDPMAINASFTALKSLIERVAR